MRERTLKLILDSFVRKYDYSRIESLIKKYGSKENVIRHECCQSAKDEAATVIIMSAILKKAFEKHDRQKEGAGILKNVNYY